MVIPVFDCEIDAYWWVLCTEKYFKKWLTPETHKMAVAALAMKGPALTWWLRWYPRHPWVTWDAFTSVFLWQFKPEWRVILPLPADEEDLQFEPQQLKQGDNVDEQMEEGIGDFNQHSSSPAVGDLDFAVPDDDDEESSFQSALTDPDDVIIPANQIEVSSFVIDEDDGEHLVEENGSSTPTTTQTLVPILASSNINSELLVDNADVVKSEFEANEQLKVTVSRVFMNLDPVMWVAGGPNDVFSGIRLRHIHHLNRCCSGPFSQILDGGTDITIGDALLFNTIPYDPGPLESLPPSTATNPKSMGVSLVHFAAYTHDPGPIGSPPLTTISYPHVFQISITMCSIVTPIVSVRVFFGYVIGASLVYINIESSCEAHYLFVKMPLKTNFSCDNHKSLLCGIEIHASFVHDEIARSGLVGPIMFLLNEKLGVVAFDCLQHCGIGLEFNFFDIVGTLPRHDSSSVKHVCSSCDANPNFKVPCDFVNQLLYYVRIEDISIEELAMIVTFKLCDTSKELKIVMSQYSHAMSSVHKLCVGYHGKLDDFIIKSMLNLSHKQKLIDDCVSESYEIASGTAFCCHCLKVLVGTTLLDLRDAIRHQLVTQSQKLRCICIGVVPYKVPKLENDQQLKVNLRMFYIEETTLISLVEHKLQNGVPTCIGKPAQMRSIGFSCTSSLLSHGMHHIINCSKTPGRFFLKEVEDMSTAAEMCLMQRRVAIQRGVSILKIFKTFALVHVVINVDPSNPFYEILESVSLLLNFVYGVASYCLRADSMANTSDFVPAIVVSNDMMALVMKVELKEQCELIDIFSKVDVKLTLIAYFAFVVACSKNKQSMKGLISIVPSHDLNFSYFTRAKLTDIAYEILNSKGELVTRSYSWGFDTFWELATDWKIVLRQWSYGGGIDTSTRTESLQFNQWDPGGCSHVHWKGSIDLEATWVDTTLPQQRCMSFNLEDKVDFNGGSNVMIQNNT